MASQTYPEMLSSLAYVMSGWASLGAVMIVANWRRL